MAKTLISDLEKLNGRIKEVVAENRRLRERNAALETENADLRMLRLESDAARERAELDAEYLAVSHKLADNPDNLIKTRRRIAQLIRNIDRCLEMLKE